MATKVICMASPKGGSGKTVLTATFAAFLVNLGKRVLMIDTDAATNGLTLMFLKETRNQADVAASEGRVARGIYEGELRLKREIVRTPIGADLIPATYSFINTELVPVEGFKTMLQGVLQLFRDDYDFIFLDAQAGSDSIAHAAMDQRVSDQVIIVSEYDPLSAAGVERLKGLFREDLTYVRTWILLNKMLPDFVRSFSDFMEVAKYASPIPWDADVVRAYARRRLALDLENGNEFTLAVVQALRSIFSNEIESDLDGWLNSKTAALREPIEIQKQDIVRELEMLIRDRSVKKQTIDERLKFRDWIIRTGTLAMAITVPATLFYFNESKTDNPTLAPLVRVVVLTSAILSTALFVFYRWFRSRGDLSDLEIESARAMRRIVTLEEQLKKLEALSNAELSSLIKHKGSIG